MGVRTIRLDDRAERILAELRKRTGLSIPEVFKRCLQAYAASARDEMAEPPYAVFRRLDLGPGGCTAAVTGEKHGR